MKYRASDILMKLSEAKTEHVKITSGVSGLDFDNRKKIKIKPGTYTVIDDSDDKEILISDKVGELYYVDKSNL